MDRPKLVPAVLAGDYPASPVVSGGGNLSEKTGVELEGKKEIYLSAEAAKKIMVE